MSIPIFKWQTLATPQARAQFLRELLPVLPQQATVPSPAVPSSESAIPQLQGTSLHIASRLAVSIQSSIASGWSRYRSFTMMTTLSSQEATSSQHM